MSHTERLENLILAYEHGARKPDQVQIELLRIMTEILLDLHGRLPKRTS